MTAGVLAVGVVNPLLLGGLWLVLAPILIHLLLRRRFRRVEWGATQFLIEAEQRTRRRTRLEQWLLLALRCLAMALLALLVSRPFVEPGLVSAVLGGRGDVHRVVVVDDSASLGYRAGAQADFAEIRAAAERLAGWSAEEGAGRVTLYSLAAEGAEPIVDALPAGEALPRIQQWLEGASPSPWPAQPRRVFERIASELDSAPPTEHTEVYVLSDFQRSDWAATEHLSESALAPLSALAERQVRVALISPESGARDNVALESARFLRPRVVAGVPAVVEATVANHGRAPLQDVSVRLEVDGHSLPPARIERVDPGGTATVSAEVTFPDAGRRELVLDIDAVDAFPLDDALRVAVVARPAIQVLLVNGAPAATPRDDEVYYLRTALAPDGPFASGIQVTEAPPEDVDAIALEDYDAVLLCNLPAPRSAAVLALDRFVRRGGGLVIFLGDHVESPVAYRAAFDAPAGNLLPLRLETVLDAAAPGVGILRSGTSPITSIFADASAGPSEYAHFRRWVRGAELSADEATVAARYADEAGSPAVVEARRGAGRVILFTTTADLDWNDWARAADGSYVVTMLEAVQQSARRETERQSFVAGSSLALALDPERYEPDVLFRPPAMLNQAAVEGRLRSSGGAPGEAIEIVGPRAERIGAYSAELRRRDGAAETRPLPVNLDRRESDLAVARRSELEAALGGVPHAYFRTSEAFAGDRSESRRELWPTVLAVLVVALMCEQLLASWFGQPRSGKPRAIFGRVRRVFRT